MLFLQNFMEFWIDLNNKIFSTKKLFLTRWASFNFTIVEESKQYIVTDSRSSNSVNWSCVWEFLTRVRNRCFIQWCALIRDKSLFQKNLLGTNKGQIFRKIFNQAKYYRFFISAVYFWRKAQFTDLFVWRIWVVP